MTELSLNVGELVDFCHREGDLDQHVAPAPTAAEGIRGHRALYEKRPESYRPEYAVEGQFQVNGILVRLRGRADGYDPELGLVEEIKTTHADPARIPPALSRRHLAQGRLYAALIAEAEDLPRLTVRLTWWQLRRQRPEELEQCYERAELVAFLEQSLRRYVETWQQSQELRLQRDRSIGQLEFPFPRFRAGQRELAELVYKAISRSGELLLEAPTGLGKTAAVLFPALKALASGQHDGIIFTTARSSGRLAAEDALQRMEAAGLAVNRLSLTARDRICFSPGSACAAAECPYAAGYYDRLPAARSQALGRRCLDQPGIEEVARAHRVCPYYLSLDLAPWMDLLIADLHYCFSLGAGLNDRLSQAGARRWSLLVDEAHNLPGRARDMYSAALSLSAVEGAQRGQRGRVRAAVQRLRDLLVSLDAAARSGVPAVTLEAPPDALGDCIDELVQVVVDRMIERPGFASGQADLMALFFAVLQVRRVLEAWGPDYLCTLSRESDSPTLQLTCLDSARLLRRGHEAAHASVLFSATLSPPDWLRDTAGLTEACVFRRFDSPFEPEQLQVFLAPQIDTRLRAREKTLPQLAERLLRWISEHPGHCMVFFPSYGYLDACMEEIERCGVPEGLTLWCQQRGREGDLLTQLQQARPVLALCVLGGIFGEGIDLPGELLSSVVVIGPGLPQLSTETRAREKFCALAYGDGFAYAFLYPALQRVNQALGRVVRSESDRGYALLVDPRYLQPAYRDLLPAHWHYRLDDRADPPSTGPSAAPVQVAGR